MPAPPGPPLPITLQQDALCIRCQYNLRGLPLDADCPECCTPVRDSITFLPSDRIPAGPLDADTPCIRCQYNLRGLPPTGRCPECSTPIEYSLRGDRLIYSSPQYLNNLDGGLLILIVALAAMIGLAVLSIFAFALMPVAAPAGVYYPTAAAFFQFIITAALTAGHWRLAAPDPSQLSSNRANGLRNAVRITALIILVMRLLILILYPILGSPGTVLVAVMLLNLPVIPATLVQLSTAFLYTRWLAARIPGAPLAARANLFAALAPLIYLVLNGPLTCIGMVNATFFSLGYVAAGVMYLLHLRNLRANLNRIPRVLPPAL